MAFARGSPRVESHKPIIFLFATVFTLFFSLVTAHNGHTHPRRHGHAGLTGPRIPIRAHSSHYHPIVEAFEAVAVQNDTLNFSGLLRRDTITGQSGTDSGTLLFCSYLT